MKILQKLSVTITHYLLSKYRFQDNSQSTPKNMIWSYMSIFFTQNQYTVIQTKTKQNSTQSVGNMPPLPPRHLLLQVLQIMPRKPKYDQFPSKGHHNEENPQSMTKIPKFDPFQEVKMVPKLEKSTICDHNLFTSEDAQDTPECKMPDYFLNGFSRKCLETPNLTHFTKSE